jgi:S1-C subfamily serine protease
MTTQWYIARSGGQAEGPLSSQEVLNRIAQHLVTADMYACRPGEAWLPMTTIEAFARAFPVDPASASAPPVARSKPAPVRSGRPLLFLLMGGAAIVLLVASAILIHPSLSVATRTKAGIVQVTTASGSGSGFFVRGPDDYVYVATAYHVVSRGEPILVERHIEVSDNTHYVQAYPESEVVAFDSDADVAVLQVRNLPARSAEPLKLASEPMKNESISSYGFPASNLTKHAGLVNTDGKIQSMVTFPVYDWVYHKTLRENAIDGLLISSNIEPGFSGGPTCNEQGEVVGINVTKDSGHTGQNGAVSVRLLKQLLDKIVPTKQRSAPKPDEVAAFLKRIQSEYLLLPVERRKDRPESEFLSALDLAKLREVLVDIRKNERDTNPESIAVNKTLRLSGQAMVGILFSRLPGRTLETYEAQATKTMLSSCEEASQRLINFLGGLTASAPSSETTSAARSGCDDLALRPLAWDLIAGTMQWEGTERDVTVVDVKQENSEIPAYRAAVRLSAIPNLVDIWVATDEGKLRLKLFDNEGNLYATGMSLRSDKHLFEGSWSAANPRVTDPQLQADVESNETVAVSFQNENDALIQHTVHRRSFARQPFPCSSRRDIDVMVEQTFAGSLKNGTIVASAQKPMESTGRDIKCAPFYQADRVATFKIIGDRLYMYRTDGREFPELRDFERKVSR